MDQRTAEAMAEKVKAEVGHRGKVKTEEMRSFGWNSPGYWTVIVVVDNYLHLGFAEPHQWTNLKAKYDL